MSLTPTARATDLPHANSPTMHSKLVCKDQNRKEEKIFAEPNKTFKPKFWGDKHTNKVRNGHVDLLNESAPGGCFIERKKRTKLDQQKRTVNYEDGWWKTWDVFVHNSPNSL